MRKRSGKSKKTVSHADSDYDMGQDDSKMVVIAEDANNDNENVEAA